MATPNIDYRFFSDATKTVIAVGINNVTSNYINLQQIVHDQDPTHPIPVVGDLVGCDPTTGNLIFLPWTQALLADQRFQWTLQGTTLLCNPSWPDLTKAFGFKLI